MKIAKENVNLTLDLDLGVQIETGSDPSERPDPDPFQYPRIHSSALNPSLILMSEI